MPNSGIDGCWFATTPEYWANLQASSGPIIGWQLWYADRTCIRSSDLPWANAPASGVQVLVVHHPRGLRNLVTGRDEYTLPEEQCSKLGLMIDEAEFNAIRNIAVSDSWRA